jgi:hypothetical protein
MPFSYLFFLCDTQLAGQGKYSKLLTVTKDCPLRYYGPGDSQKPVILEGERDQRDSFLRPERSGPASASRQCRSQRRRPYAANIVLKHRERPKLCTLARQAGLGYPSGTLSRRVERTEGPAIGIAKGRL